MLHATKRQSGVRRHHAVDKDTARFDLVNKPVALFRIFGPGGGAETEGGRICQLDCFIDTSDPKQGSNGAKNLVTISGRVFRDVCEHSRFVEITAREVS